MNKIVLLSLSLFILFASCSKDDDEINENGELVPIQQQWGFALNYTATWCGPCGDWGAPLIHDFADAGNVVAITAHSSQDPMHNSTLYSAFSSDRPVGGGIPSFYIGDIKSTSMSDMDALLNQTPKAAIAFKYSVEGTTMTIDTRTTFYSTQTGIFNLEVLLLESGIDGSATAGDYEQNGVANPESYTHDFVLRASSSGNSVYGEKISTDPTKNDVVDKQFTIEVKPEWNQQVYPVAILWKKNSLGELVFEFINAVK